MPTYIHEFVLEQVRDVFDAQALWHAQGLALFSRRVLLRDLLARHPRQQRGRFFSHCFAHVQVFLPAAWLQEDQHLYRGAHARQLLTDLEILHRADFANFLHGEDVRYRILPAPDLQEQQVRVRFGHAVYVPAAEESAQYSLQSSSDGKHWLEQGLLYAGQRLCLLGCATQAHSLSLAAWPARLEGGLLLINEGPGSKLEWQVRQPASFEMHFDARLDCHVLRANGGPGLLLRAKPLRLQKPLPERAGQSSLLRPAAGAISAALDCAGQQVRNRVWSARPLPAPASASASVSVSGGVEPTCRPLPGTSERGMQTQGALECDTELTYLPLAAPPCPVLRVCGLLLPRLSRYQQARDAGMHSFAFGLAADGRFLAEAELPLVARALHLQVDAQDRVTLASRSGRSLLPLPAQAWSLAAQDGQPGLEVMPVPSTMQDLYLGLVRLPQLAAAASLALAAGNSGEGLVLGRGSEACRGLRVLARGQEDKLCCDRLGLSRQACRVQTRPGQQNACSLQKMAQGQSLFVLDQDWQWVAEVGSEEYLLQAGQHLVLGPYLLQLVANAQAGSGLAANVNNAAKAAAWRGGVLEAA